MFSFKVFKKYKAEYNFHTFLTSTQQFITYQLFYVATITTKR